MKKIISMVIALVMLISVSDLAMANKKQTFSDVKASHWAFNSIENAAKRGVVNGHSDGTFRPESKVTREAFLKMAVINSGYTVPKEYIDKKYSYLWSMPYLIVAAENEIIGKDVYRSMSDGRPLKDGRKSTFEWVNTKSNQLYIVSADTTNYDMTRIEMADVAMRILGKVGKDNNEVMRLAVNAGIIHGMSNGDLQPQGTASRAQALTILDRVYRAMNGETLPVDKKAVAEANKDRDAYGRVIRTTELPKNSKDYPYILEGISNAMYEMPMHLAYNNAKTPTKYMSDTNMVKSDFDNAVNRIEKGMNMILNVNYKTINPEKWAKELSSYQYMGTTNSSNYKSNLEYAKNVVKNKIRIEGKIKIEPSMFYSNGVSTIARSSVEFKVLEFSKLDKNLFYDQSYRNSFGTKFALNPVKGKLYKGYTDLNVIFSFANQHKEMTGINSGTSIFENSIINGVKYGLMLVK